jgi:hypothetical protein
MNERIRELYQQAHSIRYHDGDPMRDGNPPTVYWQGEKSAKKFAELIVKECLVVINQSNGVGDDDVIRISKDVEKHFGVEE